MLVFMGTLRLFLYNTLPNYMGVSVVFFIAGIALIWHLKDTFSGRVTVNRETFEIPATGVPRLIIIARNIKFAHGLECGIIAAYLMLYVSKTALYFPKPPPGTEEWFYNNQRAFAFCFAALPFIGVILWNLPLKKARTKRSRRRSVKPCGGIPTIYHRYRALRI